MTTNNAINNSLPATTTFSALQAEFNGTPINDNLGYKLFNLNTSGGTPVNFIQVVNSNTGSAPYLKATGSDSNVSFQLQTTGTGGVQVQGTGTNDSASAGYVGEYKSSIVSGPGNNINSATSTDLTSLSLTAGDWDLQGNIYFSPSVTITNANVWISTTSATPPDVSLRSQIGGISTNAIGMNAPFLRLSLSSTTTVYLTGNVTLSAGTCTQAGGLYARRAR